MLPLHVVTQINDLRRCGFMETYSFRKASHVGLWLFGLGFKAWVDLCFIGARYPWMCDVMSLGS